MPTRVSVVCPVFNADPAFLDAAINSVFANNSGAVAQLILVDDHSTSAETIQALAGWKGADPRITLLTSARNEGPAVARNHGINAATSEWVGFIDADDLWFPDAVEKFLQVIGLVPEAEWIGANYSTLNRRGNLSPAETIDGRLPGVTVAENVTRYEGVRLTKCLASNFYFHLGSCFIKRDAIQRIGGFRFKGWFWEDWIFLLRLSRKSAIYHINSSAYILRRQHDSLITSRLRLNAKFTDAQRAAFFDPDLRCCRRESRWNLVRTYQNLAVNNLLAGDKRAAVQFALCVQLFDPLNVKWTIGFLKCIWLRDKDELLRRMRTFTTSELVGHLITDSRAAP